MTLRTLYPRSAGAEFSRESELPFRLSWVVSLAIAGWVCIAANDAWADDAQLTPVRRTTIMTTDLEASLRFYRDLLGFTVEYDVAVTDPPRLSYLAPGATKGRNIALRQGDKLGGSIGLNWADTVQPRLGGDVCVADGRAGNVSVLILTDNLAALHKRLSDAGVQFAGDQINYDLSRGPTDVFFVFDPNCLRIAFAEIERETLEQSMQR